MACMATESVVKKDSFSPVVHSTVASSDRSQTRTSVAVGTGEKLYNVVFHHKLMINAPTNILVPEESNN